MDDIERWVGSGARRGPGRPQKSERVVGERFVLDGDPLGTGGFADVYRATDRKTGEVVAVKILKNITAVDDEAVLRFRRELRLMEEHLDHPHVNTVIAHGSFDTADEIWCAMPLAVGSLADEIERFQGKVGEVVDLARQLCDGIGYVHEQGILHRDLKPGNILRSAEGLWTISDFGLAREDERQSQALTTTLAVGMGTYFYTSPEQWIRPKHAERRDDVFSVGKILQHALTGQVPLVSADQMPESPLRPVIQRATGPREGRYPTMSDLLAAIEQAVQAYSTEWEDPKDRLGRLRPRLAGETVDRVATEELLRWMQDDDDEEFDHAARALVASSRKVIEYLWNAHPAAYRKAAVRMGGWMNGGFAFEYCDDIADTARLLWSVSGDNDVLRAVVRGLVELGGGHNRWHVRDVLVDILQGLKDPEAAVVALEALQSTYVGYVDWSINAFAARSLHPVLRNGVAEIKAKA
ncbi:serine/threonine-protein kinase [Serinicoccus marinus]|uniref:serine/threonine-protein kinase n=1 Tax=Serinicoccus marinus TaxID=247333 RepID=UPI002492BC07|nr:serine/threonine-protein kinase [Serinicoccus marinus]